MGIVQKMKLKKYAPAPNSLNPPLGPQLFPVSEESRLAHENDGIKMRKVLFKHLGKGAKMKSLVLDFRLFWATFP